jgi:homoserine O-succinyltransferase
MRGFDDMFYAPHSRHTTVRLAEVQAHPALEVLATSEQAGLYLAASRDGRRVFVTGTASTTGRLWSLSISGTSARGCHRAASQYYPENDCTKPPRVTWRAHGNMLFGNWLNYFVYQETPYEVGQIRSYKHD